jgi:hypothetical protein
LLRETEVEVLTRIFGPKRRPWEMEVLGKKHVEFRAFSNLNLS